MWNAWLRHSWLGGVLVLLSVMPSSAQWQDKPFGWQPRPQPLLINDMVPRTEYWLGIQCMPVPPALRSHLQLPEKQGLLVDSVAADCPAAKAGIAAHDVLLSVGDEPLTNPLDLIQAVEAAKENKLSLEIIRGGQRKTMEVTPAKRPESAARMTRLPGEADWNTIRKWMDEQGQNPAGDNAADPFHFHLFRPGAILPKEALKPMPDNMSVVISKEGDQTAKIVVKRGEEKWELTEKEMDKLPADVRPFVEQMLGRGGLNIAGIGRAIGNAMPGTNDPSETSSDSPAAAGKSFEERVERRMAEMDKRIERMWKSLEASIQKHFPAGSEAANPPAGSDKKHEGQDF